MLELLCAFICLHLLPRGKKSFILSHLYMLEMKRGRQERVAALLLKVKGLHWHAKKPCSKFCSSLLLGQITLPFWEYLLLPFSVLASCIGVSPRTGFVQLPGPAGAQCPQGRKSELPNSCPKHLPGTQTPKTPPKRGAKQQEKGVGGL